MDGGGLRDTDDSDDTDVALDFRFLTAEAPSSGSNRGDGERETSWLDELLRSTSSPNTDPLEQCLRNPPPWIGGRKLVHRPSIRPIWKALMWFRASRECSLKCPVNWQRPVMYEPQPNM